jgi:1-acyl-sn-glycerol-3-phosphate acyltransferase
VKALKWIHTVLFFAWMWSLLLASVVLLVPLGLLKILGLRKAAAGYVRGLTAFWARQHMLTSGSRIRVTGRENIPAEGAFCVIGNHQGNFDIPILMAKIPRTLGFIAKSELRSVPLISWWMRAIGCVFIDRKNIRAAVDALKAAVEQVKNGRSIVLFPEGTRSRSGEPAKIQFRRDPHAGKRGHSHPPGDHSQLPGHVREG